MCERPCIGVERLFPTFLGGSAVVFERMVIVMLIPIENMTPSICSYA
jgi:hypothetical protein